ncbi:MAG: DNA polymerase III subunit delta' [Deltaproteobacteria bacterium]|nr:DNA polymerase III subunit delta' [Deltaproteobacteria bacterium]
MPSFSHILGQERAKKFLKNVLAGEKIPHAYLFTGIPGVGKTSTAMALAMALNCNEPVEEEGCAGCVACRQLRSGNSPDFLIIARLPDRKNILIEQIQEFNRKLGFAPLGRYRVSVIQEAETMTAEAANCLLKTLEEPPAGNIIILNAVEPLELMPTIVSRCQRVPFQPLPLRDMRNWLVQKGHMEEETARVMARISGGSLGRVLKMRESDFVEKRRKWLQMLLKLPGLSKEKGFQMAMECADEAKKIGLLSKDDGKTGALDMLALWESWYRDLLIVKVGGPAHLLINEDYFHMIKSIIENFTIDNLIDSLMAVDQAERDLRRRRNISLVMEHVALHLGRLAGSHGARRPGSGVTESAV